MQSKAREPQSVQHIAYRIARIDFKPSASELDVHTSLTCCQASATLELNPNHTLDILAIALRNQMIRQAEDNAPRLKAGGEACGAASATTEWSVNGATEHRRQHHSFNELVCPRL
jgi:hypothetical protein